MFGSQALDTAFGLVLMLFVIATAASSLLELGNRVRAKRATDLRSAVGSLLSGESAGAPAFTAALAQLESTSAYAAATTGAGRAGPAYLSAKAFADASLELTADAGASGGPVPRLLRERVGALLDESSSDVLELRAGLERWFDEAMSRLSDSYKRQATFALGAIGFVLAVAANASTPAVAARLWTGPATREAVVAAAGGVGQPGSPDALAAVAEVTSGVPALGMPLGWSSGLVSPGDPGWWLWQVLGWALTAVLVMVGAPFWFELLGRLVSWRSGGQPPTADRDPAAATTRLAARDTGPTVLAPGGAGAAPESVLLQRIKAAISPGSTGASTQSPTP